MVFPQVAISYCDNVPPIKLESFSELEKLIEGYDLMIFTGSSGEQKIYFDKKGKRFAVR